MHSSRGRIPGSKCKGPEVGRNQVCSRSSRYLSHEVVREASEIWGRKNLYKHKELLQLVTRVRRQSRPSLLSPHFLRPGEAGGPWRPPAAQSSAETVPCSVGNKTRGLRKELEAK